jgi:hypothetical protein
MLTQVEKPDTRVDVALETLLPGTFAKGPVFGEVDLFAIPAIHGEGSVERSESPIFGLVEERTV